MVHRAGLTAGATLALAGLSLAAVCKVYYPPAASAARPAVAASAALSGTATASATLAASATLSPATATATRTRRPVTTPTLEAARMTATAARIATSGTLAAATMTAAAERTATLPPPFSTVDPCVCLTPPPGPSECADIIATLHAGYRSAFATQTALARGTDTPTLPPSVTPSPTLVTPSGTPTPLPTVEATPTRAMPPTHTPTATLTPWPDACTAGGRTSCRVLLPFAYLRRAVRR